MLVKREIGTLVGMGLVVPRVPSNSISVSRPIFLSRRVCVLGVFWVGEGYDSISMA